MARLFGREVSRAEIEAHTGHLDQVGGVTPVALRGGRAAGVDAYAIATGSGARFLAVAGRALDVAAAEYNGMSLCWHSRNGVVGAEFYDARGNEWLRTFFGGLFTTCGLTNFGPPGSDRWGEFGLHGRISNTPADSIAVRTVWEGDECFFELHGTVRETRVFGTDLRLERTLRAQLGRNSLTLRDEVVNDGATAAPHMLLYHCNGGFPLLDADAQLYVSQSDMHARDADAQAGIDVWDRGGRPVPGFAEQVFVHTPIACSDGRAAAILANRRLCDGAGLALAIRFDPVQLPALFTWRMLGAGTYVMGMEPANCATITGRVDAGENGTLPLLAPGERRRYDLEFEIIDRTQRLDALLASFPSGTRERARSLS